MRGLAEELGAEPGPWAAAHLERVLGPAPGLHPKRATMLAGQLCKRHGVDRAVELVRWLAVNGGAVDVRLYTKVLGGCSKAGAAETALALLQDLKRGRLRADTRVYNAVIGACARAKRPATAERLYREMLRGGLAPDPTTFTCLINAYANVGDAASAAERFREMLELKVKPNPYVCSALISAFGKSGRWKAALRQLKFMQQRGPAPDVATYNAVIDALGRAREWERAWGVFSEMKLRDIEPRVDTYNALMTACNRSRQWQRALEVYRRFRGQSGGEGPDAATFHAALAACGRGRAEAEAEAIWAEMRAAGHRPSRAAYCSMVRACGADPAASLAWFRRLEASRDGPDTIAYNTLVQVFCEAGRLAQVPGVLGEMDAAAVPQDGITYRIIIESAHKQGDYDAVIQYFDRLKAKKLKADVAVLLATLDACEKKNEWQLSSMIFNELKILMEDNQGKDLPVAARQILYLSPELLCLIPPALLDSCRKIIDSGRVVRGKLTEAREDFFSTPNN